MSAVFDVQACIVRVREGDERASVALVEHLYPMVRRLVRNHLPRRESEEDLVQQSMIKVFQKLDTYQPREGSAFEHWVSRLTVRTCLDALRAERSRPEWRMTDLGDGETEWLKFLCHGEADAPQRTGASEAKAIVERLLAQLVPSDRLVLTLLDLEQRSTLEISQITGWTRPMVKMRAMRARIKLRQVARRMMKSEFNPS